MDWFMSFSSPTSSMAKLETPLPGTEEDRVAAVTEGRRVKTSFTLS